MTVPLGNTPAPSSTPDELKTPGLVYMAQAVSRGEAPVLMFYRTLEHGAPFAPDPKKIDAATKEPKLVYPVTVDVYFPNGPLQGRVYRRVGFINAGLTGSIRQTAIGSINVGQLNIAPGQGNPYAQLNALDPDALAWATQVHQAAGGNVFRQHDPAGETSPAPAATPAAPAPPADRFAGMPVPGAGPAQPAAPAMPAAPAGPPPGFPPAGAAAGATPAQPAPTTMPPPPGVPPIPGPPAGMPGAPAAGGMPGLSAEPPY